MRAPAGFELTCRALNHSFGQVERGVLSYFAGIALPPAQNMDAWCAELQRLVDSDAVAGLLPETHHRTFEVLGDGESRLAGVPCGAQITS